MLRVQLKWVLLALIACQACVTALVLLWPEMRLVLSEWLCDVARLLRG